MTSKQNKSQVIRAGRIGEGHLVEVSRLSVAKDGQSQQFGIDLQSLPVPDRRLSCDTVSFVRTDYMVKLLFAQKEVVGEGYLAMVVVQMTFDAIHNFLRSVNTLEAGLKELMNGQYPTGEVVQIKEKPQQSAVVTANLVFAGYSGTDACLDFYYTSPFSIKSINILNKVSVEPVVRINVPTHLLVAMYSSLQKIAHSLPSNIGKVTS